jgi:hypothetical protein
MNKDRILTSTSKLQEKLDEIEGVIYNEEKKKKKKRKVKILVETDEDD